MESVFSTYFKDISMHFLNKSKILSVSLLLSLSPIAIAGGFSYDYVQGTYQSISDSSISGVDLDATGFSFSGSFSLSENMAFNAGYGSTSYDTYQGVDIDSTSFTFGIIGHTEVSPNTDINFGFSILNGDAEATNGVTTISDDDTGNIIGFGLRHMLNDTSELNFSFSRTDIFDDTSNSTGFGIRFYTDSKVSFGVGYSTGDDVDSLLFNIRLNTK